MILSEQPDSKEAHSIAFREVTQSDIPWLVALRMATMDEHHRAAGRALSAEDHRSRVLYDFAAIQIVLRDGRDIGMIKVQRTSSTWRLVQIQLLPEHQNQGIGRQILVGLLADAKSHGAAIELNVLKNNRARELYGRLGFRVVAEKGRAVVMRVDPQ